MELTDHYSDIMSQVTGLMSMGKYDAAIALLLPVIESNPRNTEAYIHLGNAYVNKGEYKDGVDQFKKALILEPNNGEILYSIGSVYILMGDTIGAVEYYNKAEAMGYRTPELYQYLSLIFLDEGDMEQALKNVNRAIQLRPLDGRQHLLKTRIFLYAGKTEEALETLDEMNKLLPDSFASYNLRAEIYMDSGKYKEALEICDAAVERFPNDPNIIVLKLKALNAAGSYAEVVKIVNETKATGLYDTAIKNFALQESTACLGQGNAAEAVDVLDKAAEKVGEDEDILFTSMTICSSLNDYTKLLTFADRLLAVAKKEEYIPAAKFNRAEAMNNTGKNEEASVLYKKLISEFRKITTSSPYRYDVFVLRLLCHLRIGEYTTALELADYLEAYNPESSQPYVLKYTIYKEMGDTNNAEIQREKAKSIDYDSIE